MELLRRQTKNGWVAEKLAPWGSDSTVERGRLRNHFLITAGLRIEGAPLPLSLAAREEGLVLTMPWAPGVDLGEHVAASRAASGRPALPVDEVLRIGIDLAVILANLANQGVAHNAITAAHVLIEPASGVITLLNFGWARFMRGLWIEPDGQPARVDHRGDLLDLGKLLFWLATGTNPSETENPDMDALALAVSWPPERVADLPPPLLAILANLLAPAATHGYCHATAVVNDLRLCRFAPIYNTFDVGPRPAPPPDLALPMRRLGREREVSVLVNAYSDTANAALAASRRDPDEDLVEALLSNRRSVLVLIDGPAGIGKTAVAEDSCRVMARHGARIVSGKFNQFGDDRPFAALAQAFDAAILQVLNEDAERRKTQIYRLRGALGDLAQVVIDVVPRLEQLLGPQPDAPALDTDASQRRFELLFQRFVGALTSLQESLVVFLDDVQWADPASLNLLCRLLRDAQLYNLLLVAAYRSEVVHDEHPLIIAMNGLGSELVDVRRVTVNPWTREDLAQFIAETKIVEGAGTPRLNHILLEATQGNPLGVLQALRTLYDSGALRFVAGDRVWRVDAAVARSVLKGVPVVELVARQLRLLPADTRDLVSTAAFLGNRFSLRTVSAATARPMDDILRTLWPALAHGLLAPFNLSGGQQSRSDESVLQLRLAHDLVQQAAYALVGEYAIAQRHALIGRSLLNTYTVDGSIDEHAFEIVHHLNSIQVEAADASERDVLVELNLLAGRKAKASGASAAARSYFEHALALIGEDSWARKPDLAFEVAREAAESAYLAADFAGLDQFLSRLDARPLSVVNAARVHELRIQGLLARNRLAEALTVGETALGLLGVALAQPPRDLAQWPEVPTLESLALDQPGNPVIDTALRLLVWLTPCAYITSFEMYARVILTMVELANAHPASPLTAISFTNYGLTLCGIGRNPDGFRAGQLALALSGEESDAPLRCKVRALTYGFLWHWRRPVSESLGPLLDTVQFAQLCGDREYLGYASFLYCDKAWGVTALDELNRIHSAHARLVHQGGHEFSSNHCQVWLQFAHSLQGRSREPLMLKGDAFDEASGIAWMEQANNRFSLFTAHVLRALLAWHGGRYEAAAEAAAHASAYSLTATATLLSVDHLMMGALCDLQRCRQASAAELRDLLEQVDQRLAQLRIWAEVAPHNVAHKLALVEAERAQTCGGSLAAWEHYEQALRLAEATEFVHDQALINECAGLFYYALGQGEFARMRLHRAYVGYLRWGAFAVVEALVVRHPWLSSSNSRNMPLRKMGIGLEGRLRGLLDEFFVDRVVFRLESRSSVLIGDRSPSGNARIRFVAASDLAEMDIPRALLDEVARGREYCVFDQPAQDARWQADPYFAARQPNSVAAAPVLHNGVVAGAMYMEAMGARLLSRDLIGESLAWHIMAIVDEIHAERVAKQMVEAALLDPLTRLPNRLTFVRTADLTLARMRDTGQHHTAIAVIKIRQFDRVVITHGQDHGDAVLREMVKRLNNALGPERTLGRIDRVSFGLLFWGQDAEAVLAGCRRLLPELNNPAWAGLDLSIKTDIGVCFDDGVGSGASLLRDAESVIDASAPRGSGTVLMFDGAINRGVTEKELLERDLRWALQRGGLRMVYQPIVEIDTMALHAFEALLRWEHPLRGNMSIESVIAVAEESDLISLLGRWVIETVLRQIALWRRAFPTAHGLHVHINASPSECGDPEYAKFLLDRLREHDLPGAVVAVEITERTLIDDMSAAQDNISALHDAGVKLSVDDFGVGYSSLGRLHNCLAQQIKIDRSFIRRAGGPEDRLGAMVIMIVKLAEALNLEVVAEGVGELEQLEFVCETGCRLAQGYYIAKPLEADAAGEVVRLGKVTPAGQQLSAPG